MRYSNSLDILGIPSLPAHAFKHVGNRKIKLYGGLEDFADDVLGIDDSGGIGGTVKELGSQVDDFVNAEIPGGWATVAVVAGGYLYGAEMLAAEGAASAGSAEAAALASSEAAASNALAAANTTGYAGTTLASVPAGAYTGVTASSMPTQLDYSFGSGASGAPSFTATPSAATSFELAAPTTEGLVKGATPNLSSSFNPFAPTSMGGAQGLTVPSATGQGVVSAAGTFGTANAVTPSGTNPFNLGSRDQQPPTEKEKEGTDVTAAVSLLIDLLGERTKSTRGERSYSAGGAVEPTNPTATMGTAATTAVTSGMTATADKAGATTTAAPSGDVIATGVSAPAGVAEEKITADAAQAKVAESLTGVKAEQGTVSEEALAEAATVVPTETAVGKEQAAQGTATLVKDVADRTLQAGELVSGSAVDQKQVEAALAKTQAAQGVVTEEMTTQGQLNKLLTSFDAGNPPPWAAASMRSVTAQLAARGLGASSMAGQAIVQATLEAALPIAATDAKVFEQMGLQNLSNRQQTAMVLAEQRAKFLGQEFDQNFQTRVLNAARIADIADKNFTADVTIALENARISSTMDLQNLSNRQALVLAKTAQIANLETANLNNRQQVAVENAKAFLTLDIKNLDNRQQTALFKAKEIADSIISDTAAANAAKATNAANALEADKINAQLALSASQYNAAEKNKVAIFNKSAADELTKFNAQEANDRAEFNANLSTQISIANAKLLADVSTANTRETNAMAAVNAKNATDLSASTYAQLSQTYRDQLETAWKTSDNALMRANEISKVTITANATKYAGDAAADAAYYAALGSLSASLLTSSAGRKLADSIGTKISKWLGLE
jgi:hypothetical protein